MIYANTSRPEGKTRQYKVSETNGLTRLPVLRNNAFSVNANTDRLHNNLERKTDN